MTGKVFRNLMLYFGGTGIIIWVLYFFGVYFSDLNPLAEPKYFTAVILLFVIIFTVVFFRNKVQNRSMKFHEGLLLGTGVSFFVAIFAALFTLFFIEIIDKEIFEELIAVKTKHLMSNDKLKERNPEDFKKMVTHMKNITPWQLVKSDFLKSSLFGLVLTFIISVALRK